MSDSIKHECGLALVHLKKPLTYYKLKYGSVSYGLNKIYLLMEKQHNRGQDGAGFASIKLDMQPGQRYISRVRSKESHPIRDIFNRINERLENLYREEPELWYDLDKLKSKIPYIGEVMLGHVRYGTYGSNRIENTHPFLRQNNWKHRNLILAGNFNMTNVTQLFDNLVQLGQHPKERADTVTVLENIGHFLDEAVQKIYKTLKDEGVSKANASEIIAQRLNIAKVLRRASKYWDGGYAIAGLLGHGDSFLYRDPNGIRPAFYFTDDEVTVVASERPAIQTSFNLSFEAIKEVPPGHVLVTKKNGKTSIEKVRDSGPNASCSFERIYFSRGSDAQIYKERKKLGSMIFPEVIKRIHYDFENTVFSYIPNTSETSFYGMIEAAQEYFKSEIRANLNAGEKVNLQKIEEILKLNLRIEKIAIKDAKLRTFITEDQSRDELVTYIYDVTYGILKPTDTLVIIDDSIVRGTTLQKSILMMLDRLKPKKILVISSAPQIRYPDCYGIDMAKIGQFIAFRAALELHKDRGTFVDVTTRVYNLCRKALKQKNPIKENYVKQIYQDFTSEQISDKIASIVKANDVNAEVEVIFQKLENLHQCCPDHQGDWYFTGNYPTKGGNRVVNQAFVHFYEGKSQRSY
ncbi:MAG: class II glutamine amidotransferase [Flavobacteriaceae bacterium]|nr:class II glutamine amidotransferase [Flavobacteriaceae bacterium]MCY4267457.1 class II glutamine amidotransferase [Flavobacteriaceae bacterium]MCY4299141.1 class II glutamine amidotransferase [Flavobacteriaceae bacterium]